MPHTSNAAVVVRTGSKSAEGQEIPPDDVQKETCENRAKKRGPHASTKSVLDSISDAGVRSFWEKVEKRPTPDCWSWKAAKNHAGYGVARIGRDMWKAHRVAYELTNGRLPPGKLVRHICHNPACCNPDHLVAGSQRDNGADRKRRALGPDQDAGLVPIEEAALSLGIEPKRLRGFIFRNGIADPIGDATLVYDWSLLPLRQRLASL